MKKGLNSGKYHLGVLIEPKEFRKYVLKDGNIIECAYQIHGRKIPLDIIRKNIFKRHASLGLLREKKTFERKLLVWADHADILGKNYNYIIKTCVFNSTTIICK